MSIGALVGVAANVIGSLLGGGPGMGAGEAALPGMKKDANAEVGQTNIEEQKKDDLWEGEMKRAETRRQAIKQYT